MATAASWADRTDKPGVATGLAYTAVGGDVLFVEATSMPGKGNFQLTGQLGDVMKESAQAALSYVRTQADELAWRRATSRGTTFTCMCRQGGAQGRPRRRA